MNWTQVWIAVGLALPAYFLWLLLHEASHLVAVHLSVGLSSWHIYLWPAKIDGHWVFGYSTWECKQPTSPEQKGMICLAPRAVDLVGAVGFGLTPLFSGVGFIVWGVLFGAGVVDLIVGSLGISPISDLRKASEVFAWSPWRLRLAGIGTAGLSVGAVVAQMVLGQA